MPDAKTTNKEIYEATALDGTLLHQIGPRDVNRFQDTLKHVIADAASVLDVGCSSGEWLHYLLQRRVLVRRHLGIDVAGNRIEAARARFPELSLQVSFAETLDIPPESFDVVTCLEALEHIEDWQSVFDSLFRHAARQVLVSVPYRETIIQTPCIHCAKLTPLYGHLRSYSEESFPQVSGWRRSTAVLRPRNPSRPILVRIARYFKPAQRWLLVSYRKAVK